MTIIFFGTGSFGLPSLEAIPRSGHRLSAIVTSPDKPSGRNLQPKPSAVKLWGLEHRVPVIEMGKADDPSCFSQLKALKADLFVAISFGKILKKPFLDLPKLGAVNVHASLLPKYRGASPMQTVILNGEAETGVCVMRMVEALDAGAVCVTKKLRLDDRETILTLEPKLSALAGEALAEALELMDQSRAVWIEQDLKRVTVCSKIRKEDGRIDWNLSARALDRQVRAHLDWPGSYTFYRTKRLVVKKSRPLGATVSLKPGQISGVSDEGIAVATGDGCLLLEVLQLEGRSSLKASEFLKGTPLKAGEALE